MMPGMAFIRRDDADRGEVFAWWEGTRLAADSQFSCEPNEAILVLDADREELVATLGPGRHALTPELQRYVGGDEVLVIFVTTSPMKIEAGGALDDVEEQPWVELHARVTVRDPVKAIEMLPLLDDDETPEDWIAEELILAVGRAADEHGGNLAALQADTEKVAQAATGYANEVCAELGLEVADPEMAFSDTEDD